MRRARTDMLWLITVTAAVAATSALAGAIVGSIHWLTAGFLLRAMRDARRALHVVHVRECGPLHDHGASPPFTLELDVLRGLLRSRRPRLHDAERRALAHLVAHFEAGVRRPPGSPGQSAPPGLARPATP